MRCRRLPRAVTVAASGGGDSAHPFLHVPFPASPCILLLHECFNLTGEARVDVTGHGLGCLISCGAVNWSGKIMYVTSSHDIVVRRYRRANFVLRYRRTEKSMTIWYIAIIRFGPY